MGDVVLLHEIGDAQIERVLPCSSCNEGACEDCTGRAAITVKGRVLPPTEKWPECPCLHLPRAA